LAFTTRQVRDGFVTGRATQRVHRLLDLAVELPALGVLDLLHQLALLGEQCVEIGVGLAHRVRHCLEPRQRGTQVGHRVLDVLPDRLGFVERWLLLQQADRVTG
jgi:hypothetical protein